MLLSAAAASACDVYGGWITESNTFANSAANITANGTQLIVTAVTPQQWTSGVGTITGPSSIQVNFEGGGVEEGTLSSDCSSIDWTNGQTWFRGDER